MFLSLYTRNYIQLHTSSPISPHLALQWDGDRSNRGCRQRQRQHQRHGANVECSRFGVLGSTGEWRWSWRNRRVERRETARSVEHVQSDTHVSVASLFLVAMPGAPSSVLAPKVNDPHRTGEADRSNILCLCLILSSMELWSFDQYASRGKYSFKSLIIQTLDHPGWMSSRSKQPKYSSKTVPSFA